MKGLFPVENNLLTFFYIHRNIMLHLCSWVFMKTKMCDLFNINGKFTSHFFLFILRRYVNDKHSKRYDLNFELCLQT